MKISVITACYNSGATLADALDSVSAQTWPELEHIVVDGGSTDNTLEIIKERGKRVSRLITGPDGGIYDALNKGIKAATGDIVGIMHSDDLYACDSALQKVAEFMAAKGTDGCYGDLVYVERGNTDKIIRYWKSGEYDRENFRRGWMPPHPALFVKREVYAKYGGFDTEYKISADYELMTRLLYRHRLKAAYLPDLIVKMRFGGESNRGAANLIRKSLEDYRIIKRYGLGGAGTLVIKVVSKIPQFFRKPRQ